MKKGLILIALLILTVGLFGQNEFKYPIYIGKSGTGGALKLNGATSGSATLQVAAVAGTTTFQFPTTNGTSGYVLTTNGAGVLSWAAAAGGSMTYPSGSGIPLVVSGTSWGTTITNNSANWNTAYGWGDWSTAVGLKLSKTDTADMLNPYALLSLVLRYKEIIDSLVMVAGDTITISTIAPLLVDTIPLFVFGAGGGNAGDTIVFTTSTIYGSFYNAGSDTLKISELRVIMLGDVTDTLSVDILWDVNLNDATPTELNTNPLPVNSFTTGDADMSFATSKIPPGVWVWCETPGVIAGRKPTYLNAQISGYKIPKY